MLKEFKDFIVRGNVLDLAIAVIIGGAFGKIVTSLVNDVLMPPIGLLLGGMNFSNLFISLDGKGYESLDAAKTAGAATINYGLFFNTVIDFTIVAFIIFLMIKSISKLQKPAPVTDPSTKECPHCFSTISIKATRCPHCTSELK